MKYLKIFESESDYESFASGEEFVTPNVSIVGSDDGNGNFEVSNVHYTPATVIHGS